MKRSSLLFKCLFLIVLFLTWGFRLSNAQTTKSAYVGAEIYLVCPDPPRGAINQASWGSSSNYLSVERTSNYGATVTILSYFSGEESVQCDYYYYWDDSNMRRHTGRATVFYKIKCKPVTTKLNKESIFLYVGDQEQITYTLSPNFISSRISFSSSNSSVASVTNSGYVTAKRAGRAVITVSSTTGPEVTCNVTVEDVPEVKPTSISLPSNLTLEEGERRTLTAEVYPSDATYSLSWSSDDVSVASVDQSGVVTAKWAGTTKIWVNTDNGLFDYCNVTVKANTSVPTSVSLPYSMTLDEGETKTLTATVSPSNASYSLTWSSDDTNIATVSQYGAVTGKSAGTTKIRVKTDNGKSDYCEVTVKAKGGGGGSGSGTKEWCLILTLRNKPSVCYVLREKPVLTFGNKVFIKSSTIISDDTYSYDDIVNFTFVEGDPAGIESIQENAITIDGRTDNAVSISGLNEGNVAVFNLNGLRQDVRVSKVNGSVVIDFSNLPNGIYVIIADKQSFKFLKR